MVAHDAERIGGHYRPGRQCYHCRPITLEPVRQPDPAPPCRACLLLSWTLLRKDPARNPSKNTVAEALELPAIAQSVTRYEP